MIFPPENHFIGFDDGLANSNSMSRRRLMGSSSHKEHYSPANEVQEVLTNREDSQWKRIVLLIVAITVHNIPGKFSNDQLGKCLTCFGSESQCFCVFQQKIINNKVYRMVTLPFVLDDINPLAPNDVYICRTAQLTSRCCILNIYSTNILTEYFKHAAHSPFF